MGVQSLLPSLDQPFYRDEHLFVHLRHQAVMLDGQAITLTRTEYRLLALLVRHAGEIVTRPILLMQIWGNVSKIGWRRADVHINGLRRRLGIYADQYIETIIGIGYRFRPLHGPRYQDPQET